MTEWQVSTKLEEPHGRSRLRASRSRSGWDPADPGGFARCGSRSGGRPRLPRRAYAATILCVSLYTAVKAAYLSTVFATLWEERNLIYLAPIMLVGTALVFESKKLDWRFVGGAAALVLVMVLFKDFQLGYPYFEAPGFGIAALANRELHWDVGDLRRLGGRARRVAAPDRPCGDGGGWRPRSRCSCSRG